MKLSMPNRARWAAAVGATAGERRACQASYLSCHDQQAPRHTAPRLTVEEPRQLPGETDLVARAVAVQPVGQWLLAVDLPTVVRAEVEVRVELSIVAVQH
jgi:hypothetical protein